MTPWEHDAEVRAELRRIRILVAWILAVVLTFSAVFLISIAAL